MYEVVFLPSALRDLTDAVRYIRMELHNPGAALRLADQVSGAIDRISRFPYAAPLNIPLRPLEHEYRKVRVQNYLLFYWVEEQNRSVTVARVVYARRDLQELLE